MDGRIAESTDSQLFSCNEELMDVNDNYYQEEIKIIIIEILVAHAIIKEDIKK